MSDIKSPFTKEEVDKLNKFQNSGEFHPFTCDRVSQKCETKTSKKEGILIATEMGWICPCGEYKQYWAHDFMIKDITNGLKNI